MTSRPDYRIAEELDKSEPLLDEEEKKAAWEGIKSLAPDPTNPNDIQELLLDAKTFTNAAQKTPGGPVIKGGTGLGAVLTRRAIVNQLFPDVITKINPDGTLTLGRMIPQLDKLSPNYMMTKAGTAARIGEAFKNKKNWPGKSQPKLNPKTRTTWARVKESEIKKIVNKFGGNETLAKEIYKEQKDFFRNINASVDFLNKEFNSLLKTGELSGIGNLPAGGRNIGRHIEFSKDHLNSIDYLRKKGVIGADMKDNLEIVEHIQNLHKSNIHRLPDELAKVLGIPNSLEEFVLKRMDPVFRSKSDRIPNQFKQAFIIQTLDQFDDQLKRLPKGWKTNPDMRRELLTNIVEGQAQLYDELGPQLKVIDEWLMGIGAEETPKWIQNLELPKKVDDPFFQQMSPGVQQRYRNLVQDKNRLLQQMRRGKSVNLTDTIQGGRADD
tara:strand:- start:2 stop:1315 length:1314 start_codon:yes stop_codon:yes gene_type:complete